jgi:pimeloyl-ACP methyl ester carboxylesterase
MLGGLHIFRIIRAGSELQRNGKANDLQATRLLTDWEGPMTTRIELKIDVTEIADLKEPAQVALTVHLPDPATLPPRPIVCFAKPGGGYSKGYYTEDLPGPARGAQAVWHAGQGWIFVSVDHLGVGDSSLHAAEKLDYSTVAAANHCAEQSVLQALAEGTLAEGFAAIDSPLTLGIGQSMGGCMTIIQQGRYHCYDGIGVLGYSAVHTHPPTRPGTPAMVIPWLPRDTLLQQPLNIVNAPALARAMTTDSEPPDGGAMAWGFHYDDVDPQIATDDLAHFARGIHDPTNQQGFTPHPWHSLTTPGAIAQSCTTPGAVAPEAAAVTCPVLVALGERDVSADPRGELRAYQSSPSVDFYICPHMGHMHNFASTRELFWRRIQTWAEWVQQQKVFTPD